MIVLRLGFWMFLEILLDRFNGIITGFNCFLLYVNAEPLFFSYMNRVSFNFSVIIREPWRRWEDNIKMDLQEVGCWGMDWIEMV